MTSSDIYSKEYFKKMRGYDGDCAEGSVTNNPLYQNFLALVNTDNIQEKKMLDAGCGRGELLEMFARLGVKEVWGVDFSEDAVQLTQERLKAFDIENLTEKVVHGSLDEAHLFEENSFDLIYMTDVVEHLPPQTLMQALKNIRAWLKPDGMLVIHTFPTLGPHKIFTTLLKIRGATEYLNSLNQIHCNVQTRRMLKQTLDEVGLNCQKMWLQNDIIQTSSAFQHMSDGFLKKIVKYVFDDFVKKPFIQTLCEKIGLSEFISPSIYCFCTKDQ